MENIIEIDLKKGRSFIGQYIELRNACAGKLLSSPVEAKGTMEWLAKTDVEIRGLVSAGVLLGVVLLYTEKGNEITFFVRYPNNGYGCKLLDIIEKRAKERGIKNIWAWVLADNSIARHVFEKSGFLESGASKRDFNGHTMPGVIYKKDI